MPVTSDQLALARSWIGETETDVTFSARYDRLGALYGFDTKTLDRAIEESLRAQLAALTLDQPSNFSKGDLNVSFGQNIIALMAMLKDFLNTGGTADNKTALGGSGVTKLHRRDYR